MKLNFIKLQELPGLEKDNNTLLGKPILELVQHRILTKEDVFKHFCYFEIYYCLSSKPFMTVMSKHYGNSNEW